MIIEIAAQGGFGGITAAQLRKTIDVEDQPEQMRQELCDAFEPDELARLARQPCGDCAVTSIVYFVPTVVPALKAQVSCAGGHPPIASTTASVSTWESGRASVACAPVGDTYQIVRPPSADGVIGVK